MAKRKNSKNTDLSQLLPLLIPLTLYGMMFKYLDDLEKNKACECSNTKNRKLLKQLIVAWAGVTIVFNLLPFVMKGNNLNYLGLLLALTSIGIFIGLSVIFVKYERQLYAKDCKCSEDIKKTIFRYYLYIGWALYIIIILFNLLYIFIIIKSGNNNNVIKTNL